MGIIAFMYSWFIAIVACAICAMNGHPLFWSSLPILVLAAVVAGTKRGSRQLTTGGPLMTGIILASMIGFLWSALIALFGHDFYAGVAWVGGGGAVVLGFIVSSAATRVSFTWTAIVVGSAIGYSIHAMRLLGWFIGEAGWSLPNIVKHRWDMAAIDGASLSGFGNLGNNAVLAAMLLPALLVTIGDSCGWRVRLILAFASVLALAVLTVTQSRSALAVTLMMCIALLLATRQFKALVLFALAMFGAVILGGGSNGGLEVNTLMRLEKTVEAVTEDASVGERLSAIQEGWHITISNPLFGIGSSRISEELTFTAPHQWHLHQSLEWGVVVGLSLSIATILTFILFAEKLRGSWLGDPVDRRIAICLSVPTSYLAIATIAGAQWHYGMASVWPSLCGLCFGVAWGFERDRRSTA